MSEAVLHVPADHPAFAGHFPGAPLLPGAVLLDEVAARAPLDAGSPLRFDAVKFRRPVPPETTLRFRFEPSGTGFRFLIEDEAGCVAQGVVTRA